MYFVVRWRHFVVRSRHFVVRWRYFVIVLPENTSINNDDDTPEHPNESVCGYQADQSL